MSDFLRKTRSEVSKEGFTMSEELYLYFMQSDDAVSIKELFQNKKEFIAGRKNECDLHLSQYFDKQKIMRVSREHFMISQKESRLFIEDLKSTHGTEVDYKKLSPNTPLELRVGSIIRLAKEDNFLIRVIDDQTIDGTATIIEDPQSQTSPPKKESGSSSEEAQGAKENKKESGLYFDEALEAFIVDGEAIHLSPTLDDLLKYLYNNAERSCSFHELRQNVWHGMAKIDTIRAAVYSLRKKLDKVSPGAGERYIHNLHGYGYKLTLK